MFETNFPGNTEVLNKLIKSIQEGGVLAFTGAGTGIPQLPSWGSLINKLINQAKSEGLIDEALEAELKDEDDPLHVVDELSNIFGESQLKSKVCDIYGSLKEATNPHKALIRTNFQKYLTLNYDTGLEKAAASEINEFAVSTLPNQVNEIHQWMRNAKDERLEIVHWHGIASNSESIILSNSDYLKFYDRNIDTREQLRSIFKTYKVVMVGFGFTDPFITRQLNSVMQPLPIANMHFAIIGYPSNKEINISKERRKYASRYKLEVVFYPINVSGESRDHRPIMDVLESIQKSCDRNAALPLPTPVESSPTEVDSKSYTYNLFTIGDRYIYCEPNIWHRSGPLQSEKAASIDEILNSDQHISISAPHEYGLTNLGKRILFDLEKAGKKVILREASSLPNYQRKLLIDPELSKLSDHDFRIIIDNFIPLDHQRMLNELMTAYPTAKCIILHRASYNSSNLDDDLAGNTFTHYELRGLSRHNIREVIEAIAPRQNTDTVSAIVEKVYTDLLQLCIPLTPSNIIMYASVLCKDGSFSPVSRLNIVERFVSEALSRPSDAYADTFNFQNRTELISGFCHHLLMNGRAEFSRTEWNNYCARVKKDDLSDFNHSSILGDLISGRIISSYGENFYFKYRMFFSYFAGRQISSHPELLESAINSNLHLQLDGLLEVLCGTLTDSSQIIDDITDKYTMSVGAFYQKYPISGLDFHKGLKWERQENEGKVWDHVATKLDEGPASTTELDNLKSSISSERRTVDQKVSIIEFIASEKNVSASGYHLKVALEGAKRASGQSKLAAAKAIIGSFKLAYEVASVFAPLIAERKYVSWNGFTYINLIESELTDKDQKSIMISKVISALPTSMAGNAANAIGVKKLGPVFASLLTQQHEDPIDQLITFSLLLRSQPVGWLKSARSFIEGTKRDDIYFRHALSIAMWQFRNEVNTERARAELKDLIASMRLIREKNIKSPSKTAVNIEISKLDSIDAWAVPEHQD